MIFLLMFAALTQEIPLRKAIICTQQHDYVTSEAILSKLTPTAEQRNAYEFYRLINAVRLNQKREALKRISILENICVGLPERYKVATALIKNEVNLWKDAPDDLADISREMDRVKDRLGHARGGPETQKIQEEILARLDKKIKDLEQKANPPQADGDGDGEKEEPQRGSNSAQKPLEDSQIVPEGGKGTVNPVKLKKLREQWGSLPPRAQAAAIQEITRGLSRRHQEAIHNYFRNVLKGVK